MHIIDYNKINLEGKNVLMIGAGDLVGKPVTFLLMQRRATVTVANASTRNLAEISLNADIIISGTGVPNLVTAEMVKDGAVVIDAGTAESAGGIGGDVNFESVSKKASLISPVPGGVGPVTVAMLLYNTIVSAKINKK
jgi:methylenetetrahydrofolate dehydrogenase (NADP+)/methenyltetrahydrofolate cyclohydrolase